MVPRLISPLLRERLAGSPAVALTGPRQAGKTTLARSMGGVYFDLEQESERLRLDLVVKAELLAGARKSRRVEANLALLADFFAPFSRLPFDDDAAQHFGAIRADLERAGAPIGAYDMMIAATARAHDLVLVTHNTGEFSRVVGLRLEDWEEG